MSGPAVAVEGLAKTFHGVAGGGPVRAVGDVSLEVAPGETLAIVGESGSGKSTLGRCILRLIEPTAGRIVFEGEDITSVRGKRLRDLRTRMQIVFQDPYAAVNPRVTIGEILEEPLILHSERDRRSRREQVLELLRIVGLERTMVTRYPHQLSGGQLQRVGIARAMAVEPTLVVLDEPTSSLDVSVRAGILALLRDMQERFGSAFLLISHDLTTVRNTADRVAVMYRGRFVETGSPSQIFESPQHPYTQALLSAALPARTGARPQRLVVGAGAPHNAPDPPGCPFAPRCPLVREDCVAEMPARREVEPGHGVRCVRCDDGTNILPARTPSGGPAHA